MPSTPCVGSVVEVSRIVQNHSPWMSRGVLSSTLRQSLSTLLLVGAGCATGFTENDAALRTDADSTSDAEVRQDADYDSDVEDLICEACLEPHAEVTAGLSKIHFDLSMSRVQADCSHYAPLVWASPRAAGGDQMGLAGTLPAPGWLGIVGEGRIVVWAGHEGALTGDDDGRFDNDGFRQNLFAWLLDEGQRVGVSMSHGEWLQIEGISPSLSSWLSARSATPVAIETAYDATLLTSYDVVVFGNPWGDITDEELDALELWVRNGGSLFVLGLGWSWPAYNDDPNLDRYPVNRLGDRLGFRVMDGSIRDPAAPGGTADRPAYAIRPLSEYTPRDVTVLRAVETNVNRVKDLALGSPEDLFVIEGVHMGLQLPTADWPLLDDPNAALDAMDRLYLAELDLAGGVNAPFDGDMIWAIAHESPGDEWWMHSGNPIVFQTAAARTEIIPRFNAAGHPGWGIAHEQGHNMHGDSCGNLFVPDGTAETWTNVFALWSYRQNGWDFVPQMGADLFDAGHAYSDQPTPNFDELLADPFILLGCLELIWSRYGWDGMRRFMTQAATDTAALVEAGDDVARTAYLVEELSHAYEIDFASLIAHWGFAVSDSSRAITIVYPPSDIL